MSKSTAISWRFGDLADDIVIDGVTWTPEMIETALTRTRRSFIAGARQLNIIEMDDDIEDAALEAQVFPHPDL